MRRREVTSLPLATFHHPTYLGIPFSSAISRRITYFNSPLPLKTCQHFIVVFLLPFSVSLQAPLYPDLFVYMLALSVDLAQSRKLFFSFFFLGDSKREAQIHLYTTFSFFFLIKQLVVNSKKIGGSAAGQTKRIEKNRSLLVSLSTQLTTTTVLQFNTFFHLFVFPALSAQTKDPIFFSVATYPNKDGSIRGVYSLTRVLPKRSRIQGIAFQAKMYFFFLAKSGKRFLIKPGTAVPFHFFLCVVCLMCAQRGEAHSSFKLSLFLLFIEMPCTIPSSD